MPKIRVGFIGAGRIADVHSQAYLDPETSDRTINPTGELYAVADSSPGRAEQRKAEWGTTKAYTDYHDLLADKTVDAVEILLPHHLHLPVATEALRAGKHVSLQKPMTNTLAEADQLIAEVKKHPKQTFRIVENFESFEQVVLAKHLIEQGEIGEPVAVRIKNVGGVSRSGWAVAADSMAWRTEMKTGGPGQIFDGGHHSAALAMFFMGPVERVHAFVHKAEDGRVAYSGSPSMISWVHAGHGGNGAPRYGSWQSTASQEMMVRSKTYSGSGTVEITGSKGIIWVNKLTGELGAGPSVTVYRDGAFKNYSDVNPDDGNSFRRAGQVFTKAVADGEMRPRLTPEYARSIMAFTLAIIRSGEEGREVTIKEMG
ncbi:MAG: Gfo/Idh/MocA family oxidoreductase [Dehalococcoidia bacterium]|nr:Gfo/Idh/MocA family oxidoreductase [Dehalococcoidia bacterium]MSQ35281.1 Gfo/Idh/MocA family oxidoreductase [Dehalococcoidia bacterium]